MQFEFQQQLSSQTVSLKEEQEDQQLVQVSVILIVCPDHNILHLHQHQQCCYHMFLTLAVFLLQLQQLEEHLETSKEELNQLKSDLQENVELVGFIFTVLKA